MRIARWAPLAVVVVMLAPTIGGAADPGALLKSRDYKKRLEAVAMIRADGGENAEKWLLSALKDKDWEVVQRAVEALAQHGGEKAIKPLVNLASGGPVRRVRLAAAAALARLDSEEAAKRLGKRLRRDEGVNAAEALAVLALAKADPDAKQVPKAVTKAMKSKDERVRAATADAIGAFPPEDQVARFEKLLDDESIVVVAAALDSLRKTPRPALLAAAAAKLADPDVNDVLSRRAIAAIDAIFGALKADEQAGALSAIEDLVDTSARAPKAAAHVARLIGTLGAAPPPPPPPPEKEPAKDKPSAGKDKKEDAPAPPPAKPKLPPGVAIRLLGTALGMKAEGARTAAVHALQRIGTAQAIERAAGFLADAHARVRFQALRAVVAARGLEHAATLEVVADRLTRDEAVSVREEAAVLLGRSRPEGKPFVAPVSALSEALNDETWSVAAVAAVSLGKTRSETAVAPLAALLDPKKVKDWRRRGAAVIGLGKVRQRQAVPHLIRALKDRDTWVRRNAFEFLKRLTKRNIPADRDEWTAWWKRNGPAYVFEDREKVARMLKKGGYAVKPIDVYDKGKAALDVVVLQSRGDHIEKLLDELGIAFRITRAAQVPEAEVHSFAVFVSNCTGEIQKGDIERLQWFVRVGGYLFCSCWALHHTVEPVYPGLVRKLGTKGAVLDNVRALPCPGDSPYLEGVFRHWTQPIYVLYGSHLIEVLQPERVEVLIDSPEAAERWGGGNMACWFPAGHGVILDSANHFDLQGLERVAGLKTAEARMGYAMDHMGMDYPEMRLLARTRVWDRQADAVKEVRDLSAFRFITNFARLKRKTDP